MQLPLAIITIAVYLILYFLFGQAMMLVFKIKNKSIVTTIMVGFFVYFALFQLFALPFKVGLKPLSNLSILWAIIVIIVCVMAVIFGRREISKKFETFKLDIHNNKKSILAFAVIIVVQLIIIESNSMVGSWMDASYYIGEVSASVYTDTIGQYEGYTGLRFDEFNWQYLIDNYTTHSAVACKLTGIHPLVETRTVMTAIVIILYNIIILKIGQNLFKNKFSSATIMVGLIAVINMCFVSVSSTASFYFNRTFESKTILGSIIVPMIFYLLTEILLKKRQKGAWPSLFFVVAGAFCLNMSAVYIVSIMLVAFLIPAIVVKKRPVWILFLLICMIPCFAVAAYMLVAQMGFRIAIN